MLEITSCQMTLPIWAALILMLPMSLAIEYSRFLKHDTIKVLLYLVKFELLIFMGPLKNCRAGFKLQACSDLNRPAENRKEK